ncbi:NRAMP family divalent metal transporter [Alicyclobacillus tolerans]|uniref:Mn2+/Fe2+ NRAMP family transporter n=1 Tax=Alicyclobacillus tolerans TaxID=90970 RepID=A0ABT9LYE7_9BACL|nr:divalent metal cation transporter [Alicyclobacillus tengchongensis]MDP9729298.1 Mn2+/Fe2+ NRAMP family transporter [Alicyclobacillus tengchongensis]
MPNADRADVMMPAGRLRKLMLLVSILGPGLMVMLADTDAGSVITAAQSGAMWGYRMVLPQIVLMPILYFVQEITVRLGIVTGKGHGTLIREKFGKNWALLSVITLFITSVGALVTEFSGVAGVSAMFGIPKLWSVSAATILLIVLGVSGSYRRVERVGIAMGLFQLFFVVAMFWVHPSISALTHQMMQIPLSNRNYLFLLAANVGAVIMPWMIFYQQGAVIDKGLRLENMPTAKRDTLIGAIVTQLIMLAVVVVLAVAHPHQALNTIGQIATAVAPFMGEQASRWMLGLGMLGASMIAALVVSIAGAWGVSEAFGIQHSLNARWRDARWFYSIYTLAHVLGAVWVLLSVDLVQLNIDIEVMNAILLPIVLGFLLLLEAKALPDEWRMKGAYKYMVWAICLLVMVFGLYTLVSL